MSEYTNYIFLIETNFVRDDGNWKEFGKHFDYINEKHYSSFKYKKDNIYSTRLKILNLNSSSVENEFTKEHKFYLKYDGDIVINTIKDFIMAYKPSRIVFGGNARELIHGEVIFHANASWNRFRVDNEDGSVKYL